MKPASKRTVGLLSTAALAVGLLVAPATAEEHNDVAVNVTFLCQAPEDGTALAFGGVDTHEVEVEAGDYIWRVGDERDGALWSSDVESVGYEFIIDTTTYATGEISPGEVQFQVHTTGGAASLNVDEEFTNLRGGTAMSGDRACEMVVAEPEPKPEPKAKDECKDGGWEEHGFRNQGLCIASIQASDNAAMNR